MKKCVLTTIVVSMLSCSLLLAEDTITQQVQPAVSQCTKMSCCNTKSCKSIEARAERLTVKLKVKAEKAKADGDTRLADLYTACAEAQCKVAIAAKAAAGCECMGICRETKDLAKVADIEAKKRCDDLCGKLKDAREKAAQVDRNLGAYKKSVKKMKKD